MSRFELVSAINDLIFDMGGDKENTLDFINECIDDMVNYTDDVIRDMESLREDYCLDNGICPNCENTIRVKKVVDSSTTEFQGVSVNQNLYIKFCANCGENF